MKSTSYHIVKSADETDPIAALRRERDGWKANCQVQLEETHRHMAENAKLRAALEQWREWYERDGSVGGASLVYEETEAAAQQESKT